MVVGNKIGRQKRRGAKDDKIDAVSRRKKEDAYRRRSLCVDIYPVVSQSDMSHIFFEGRRDAARSCLVGRGVVSRKGRVLYSVVPLCSFSLPTDPLEGYFVDQAGARRRAP